VAELKKRDVKLLAPIAHKFNLSYTAFGAQITEDGVPAHGSLVLSDLSQGGLEPAPVTPTGADAHPYRLLSGTIKATFNAYRGELDRDTSEIVVAPSMMSGNTGAIKFSSQVAAN
jgi:Gly-Xaa carboxypeptidase